MIATVASSYQLLDEEEKRAFRCLSVLPALFPIHAAAAVLRRRKGAPIAFDDALDLVTRLMDKSLLVVEPGVARRPMFRMLETVRAYAAHQLTAAGEHPDAMEGLVRYCLDESATCAEGMVGLEQVDRLDRVHHDLDSYRSALEWLIGDRHAAEAADIVWRLTTFWMVRGLSGHGLFWCERILNLGSVPQDAQAKLVLTMAIMRYTRGELDRARIDMQDAYARGRDSGDLTMLAGAELMLGHIEFATGNVKASDRWRR
jgi:predicted ATPase